jgi:hypothetical protein
MRTQYGLLCMAAAMVIGFSTTAEGAALGCGCIGNQRCCYVLVYHGTRRVCAFNPVCASPWINKLHAPKTRGEIAR